MKQEIKEIKYDKVIIGSEVYEVGDYSIEGEKKNYILTLTRYPWWNNSKMAIRKIVEFVPAYRKQFNGKDIRLLLSWYDGPQGCEGMFNLETIMEAMGLRPCEYRDFEKSKFEVETQLAAIEFDYNSKQIGTPESKILRMEKIEETKKKKGILSFFRR